MSRDASVVPASSTARRLQMIILAVSGLLTSSALTLAWHTATAHPGVPLYNYLLEGSIGAGFILALAIVLVIRKPDHPVTWAFVAMALFGGLQQSLGGYAVEAVLAEPGTLPLGRVALTGSFIAQTWFVLASVLMLNIFPTGRPLPGGWRLVVWALVPAAILGAMEASTTNQEIGSISIPAVVRADLHTVPHMLNILLIVLVVGGTVTHVAVRFYRSKGTERQQLKWFVFAVVVGIAVLVTPWVEDDLIGSLLWALVPAAVMTSIAFAILRHRLYDIDRIISRTVSYALVVGVLGLVVLGLVTLLAVFLPSDDPLVVAVATLAAAAMFTPVRRRVQALVDRRFNRTRYDSDRVIDEFAGSLRDQVDPDEVVTNWVDVISETMEPSAVGVWVSDRRAFDAPKTSQEPPRNTRGTFGA